MHTWHNIRTTVYHALKHAHRRNSTTACSSVDASSNHRANWSKAISDAEKVIGYPMSFLSLRCLLSDEVSNIAVHVRKLIEGDRSLLKTARDVMDKGNSNMQTRALIILLLSKVANHQPDGAITGNSSQQHTYKQQVNGILHEQRSLAEIVEMIHIAHGTHRSVRDVPQSAEESSGGPPTPVDDTAMTNKLAILCGDYLLSVACNGLASLRHPHVMELISTAMCDLLQAEFVGRRDRDHVQLPERPPVHADCWHVWTQQCYLETASLIANGCRAALMLAKHSADVQQLGYVYGKALAFAWKANEELLELAEVDTAHPRFSLTSAPVLLHLQREPTSGLWAHITQVANDDNSVDFRRIHHLLTSSGDVMQEARDMCNKYAQNALAVLQHFVPCDARSTLENITRTLTGCV